MNVVVLLKGTGIWKCFSTFKTSVFVYCMSIIMSPFCTRCVEMFVTCMAVQIIVIMFYAVVDVPEFYCRKAPLASRNNTLKPIFVLSFFDAMHFDIELRLVTISRQP